jgi:hypothetical protein
MLFRIATCPAEFPASLLPFFAGALLVIVGHKPKAIASMGRIDGTSRDNGRPPGVVDAFQVSKDSVEPILANRCRNLFSHEDSGPAGTDEAKEVGPQVPVVILSSACAGDREWLAGTGACPQLALVRPSSQSSCKGPPADAGEEVTLSESVEVRGLYIHDAPGVYDAWRYVAGINEVAQPLGGVGVDLVVVSGHPAGVAFLLLERS